MQSPASLSAHDFLGGWLSDAVVIENLHSSTRRHQAGTKFFFFDVCTCQNVLVVLLGTDHVG